MTNHRVEYAFGAYNLQPITYNPQPKMAIAFDINETREYILKTDRELPSEQQTIFLIGTLDALISNHLKDGSLAFKMSEQGPDAKADIAYNSNFSAMEKVRFGLKEWKNLLDKTGKEILFDERIYRKSFAVPKCGNRTGLTDIALNLIKPYLKELASEVENENWLSELAEKNSDLPSKQS